MAGNRDAEPSADDTSAEALLKHAIRVWKAEEENARRLGRRVNLNLTIVAAVFGIGLLRFLDTSLKPGWLALVVASFFVVGLVLISLGGLYLLKFFHVGEDTGEGTEEEPYIASELLLPRGEEEVEALPDEDLETVHLELYVKTLRAADHLGSLNYRERERINRAQQWMFLGFFSILEALVGFSIGPTGYPGVAVGVMVAVGIAAVVARTQAG